MEFIDTYPLIRQKLLNQELDQQCWQAYADQIIPGLSQLCLEDAAAYDLKTQVMPLLRTALADQSRLDRLQQNFIRLSTDLSHDFQEVFHTDLDVTVIFYIGLANGAGWAEQIDGKSYVLLGIEKIFELGWDEPRRFAALIYHELGHIWHASLVNDPPVNAGSTKALWQLYQEGVAMYCEQRLCHDNTYYHQDRDGWLEWCLANETRLKHEYLYRVDHGLSTQCFFGDWVAYEDHADVGYFLGCRFFWDILRDRTLNEAASMDIETLKTAFNTYVKR